MKEEDLKKLDKIESILTDCQSTLKEIRAKSEQEYEPKEGDFVYCNDEDNDKFIFIFHSIGEDGEVYRYCSLSNKDLYIQDINLYVGYFQDKTEFRPATEEEKQLLLDKLHEVGKDWDAENKKIVDYRWRAEIGGMYFYLDYDLEVRSLTDMGSTTYNRSFKSGNYFQTREQAEAFRAYVKAYKK